MSLIYCPTHNRHAHVAWHQQPTLHLATNAHAYCDWTRIRRSSWCVAAMIIAWGFLLRIHGHDRARLISQKVASTDVEPWSIVSLKSGILLLADRQLDWRFWSVADALRWRNPLQKNKRSSFDQCVPKLLDVGYVDWTTPLLLARNTHSGCRERNAHTRTFFILPFSRSVERDLLLETIK